MANPIFSKLSPLSLLTLVLWGEGRGESIQGRIAIGCVIRNRVDARKQDYKTVILAPQQFSCFSPAGGDANYQAVLKAAEQSPMDDLWMETAWIAGGVLTRQVRDVTGSATNYLTTQLYYDHPPAWALKCRVVKVVGSHTFLVEK